MVGAAALLRHRENPRNRLASPADNQLTLRGDQLGQPTETGAHLTNVELFHGRLPLCCNSSRLSTLWQRCGRASWSARASQTGDGGQASETGAALAASQLARSAGPWKSSRASARASRFPSGRGASSGFEVAKYFLGQHLFDLTVRRNGLGAPGFLQFSDRFSSFQVTTSSPILRIPGRSCLENSW